MAPVSLCLRWALGLTQWAGGRPELAGSMHRPTIDGWQSCSSKCRPSHVFLGLMEKAPLLFFLTCGHFPSYGCWGCLVTRRGWTNLNSCPGDRADWTPLPVLIRAPKPIFIFFIQLSPEAGSALPLGSPLILFAKREAPILPFFLPYFPAV